MGIMKNTSIFQLVLLLLLCAVVTVPCGAAVSAADTGSPDNARVAEVLENYRKALEKQHELSEKIKKQEEIAKRIESQKNQLQEEIKRLNAEMQKLEAENQQSQEIQENAAMYEATRNRERMLDAELRALKDDRCQLEAERNSVLRPALDALYKHRNHPDAHAILEEDWYAEVADNGLHDMVDLSEEEKAEKQKELRAIGRLVYRQIYLNGVPPAVDLLKDTTISLHIKKIKTVKQRQDGSKYARMRVASLSDHSNLVIYENEVNGRRALSARWFPPGQKIVSFFLYTEKYKGVDSEFFAGEPYSTPEECKCVLTMMGISFPRGAHVSYDAASKTITMCHLDTGHAALKRALEAFDHRFMRSDDSEVFSPVQKKKKSTRKKKSKRKKAR